MLIGGSCWAFATAAVLESQVALKSGLLFDFSPQQIAMCSPNPDNCGGSGGCYGATSEIAFDYLVESGVMEEYVMGYNAYFGENVACGVTDEMIPKATITGFTHLPTNNYTALMNSVAQVGPISISVDADAFHSYESGIFDGCNQEQPNINHAVTLVGYGEEQGEKYWLVRNSWSASYGEAGYIRVKRTDEDDEVGSGDSLYYVQDCLPLIRFTTSLAHSTLYGLTHSLINFDFLWIGVWNGHHASRWRCLRR